MPKRTPKATEIKPTRVKKQTELPGIEKPAHPELDTLLAEHHEQTSGLGAARQRLGELNVTIEQKAKELGITTYRNDNFDPPLILTITSGTKVKVKVAKSAAPVDESEHDDE